MDEQFFKNLLDAFPEGVYCLNLDQEVIYWNKAAERLSGYAAREVVGRSCADNLLRHVDGEGRELCLTGCPLAATMRDGKHREAHVYLHHKFGHRVPILVRASPLRDHTGAVIGAVEVFSDNSKNIDFLKEMEALRRETLADPLTGIGNRRYADLTIAELGCTLAESEAAYGLAFADIDLFKRVNDTFGHAVGDQVLTMVARTIDADLRPLDVFCRWGGEEFLIFIPNIGPTELAAKLERLRMLVAHSWLDRDGETLRVTVSFGGAVAAQGECVEAVMERADRQLYRSKQGGRNRVSVEGAGDAEDTGEDAGADAGGRSPMDNGGGRV